ncbi:OmpA family protein, partial [Gemmatimonadota bacterium]
MHTKNERIVMITRKLWSLVVALVIFLPPAMAAGQDSKAPLRGPWEIAAFAGGFDDDYEFDPDGRTLYVDPDNNVIFGGFLGYHLPYGFFVGAEGRYVPLDMRPQGAGITDLDAYFFNGLLGYTIPLHDYIHLYAVGGIGQVMWRPRDYDSENEVGYTYGAGANLFVTNNIAVKAEMRMHQVDGALTQVSRDVAGVAADETFWGWAFTVGLSYRPGGSKDADKDGIIDENDACPDTPFGVEVDSRGCPLDSDGDGVPDYLDECPNTPRGAVVNAQGCPLDSDGDGVFDGLDACPNTPAGAPVDSRGCPLDSDGDGVPDYMDDCPNTPRGTRVDARGCPIPVEPEPEVRSFTFEDVNFEFDSSAITEEGRRKLNAIGDSLLMVQNSRIEVHGHTDWTGEEDYNMGLSQRRAQAVQDYLLANFNQFRASQFTIRAFGESQPIADNATREGRAQNRRV